MMDLIERFVREVGRRIPAAKREEVVAELRSALLDAVEGRDARTEDDVVAVLREFGDPVVVAAAYAPERQYLIGPELYPAFVGALRTWLSALPLVVGAWFLAAIARGPDGWIDAGDLFAHAIELTLRIGLFGGAVILVVYVVLQRGGRRTAAAPAWDPRALPADSDADRAPRAESAFSLAMNVAVAVFIGAVARQAAAVPPAEGLRLIVDVVLVALPILMASLVVEALVWCVVLVQGRWRGWTRAARVLGDGIAFIAFVVAPLEVASSRGGLEALGMPARVVTSVLLTLWIIAAVIFLDTTMREVRAHRRRRAELAAPLERVMPRPPRTPKAEDEDEASCDPARLVLPRGGLLGPRGR